MKGLNEFSRNWGTSAPASFKNMTDEKVSSSDFSKMFMATPGSEVCGDLTIMSDLQNFPCRCSVLQEAPKRNALVSGITANSKSKPASPLVDARVRKHQLETRVASQQIQAQGKTAHSTRSCRNYRLDGKQHMIEVLKTSPNPAARGVEMT